MAQTLQVKMSRNENSPWGFRLHGGVDFGTPLTIQKVGNSFRCSFDDTSEVYVAVLLYKNILTTLPKLIQPIQHNVT